MAAIIDCAHCRRFVDLVDVNGDGEITVKEMVYGFEAMMKDWKALKRSWSGHETLSRAYHISTGVVYIIIGFILWMIVFDLSYKNVLLPLVSSGCGPLPVDCRLPLLQSCAIVPKRFGRLVGFFVPGRPRLVSVRASP
jgi:hypothetical protein